MSLADDAASLLATCRARGIRVATAESCTGGMIAAALTAIAGSSDVVECGFVVYSNNAKSELLGVPAALITRVGAVSEEVACAMAQGALARSPAQLSIAVTGIAGPGGGSATTPVGLVHLACARRDAPILHHHRIFPGDRTAIREATVIEAFAMMHAQLAR